MTEPDNVVLAAVFRRALADDDVYVDTTLGELVIDGHLDITPDEAAVIERLWRTAHNIPEAQEPK